MNMKLFTCTNFIGYYPVGTSAIVLAPDRDIAEAMLHSHLISVNLNQGTRKLELTEVAPLDKMQVIVLTDGNY